MKNTHKAILATFALFTMTTLVQAQEYVETKTQIYTTNLGPGYSDSIDMASIKQLDKAVEAGPEFEQPNNFMSDEGVYRYAYYAKTGVWLTLKEAREALRTKSPVENI